jgi:molecular chaperone DnaK
MRILELYQWDVRTSPRALHGLKSLCQQAKVKLSVFPSAQLPLGMADTVLGDKLLEISQADIERPVYELLQRTFSVCDEVLHRAGMAPGQVDEIVLVGGSTNLPAVRRAVAGYFGREPLISKQADCQVALGACLHSALQASHRVA